MGIVDDAASNIVLPELRASSCVGLSVTRQPVKRRSAAGHPCRRWPLTVTSAVGWLACSMSTAGPDGSWLGKTARAPLSSSLSTPTRTSRSSDGACVVLNDGSQADVWAHGVTGLSDPEDDRDYEFEVLMDVDTDIQGSFQVTAKTPSNPRRVAVAVTRFPRGCVREITTIG